MEDELVCSLCDKERFQLDDNGICRKCLEIFGIDEYFTDYVPSETTVIIKNDS